MGRDVTSISDIPTIRLRTVVSSFNEVWGGAESSLGVCLFVFVFFLGGGLKKPLVISKFDISLTYLGHCDLERSSMAARWWVCSLDLRIYINNNRVSVAKSSCFAEVL